MEDYGRREDSAFVPWLLQAVFVFSALFKMATTIRYQALNGAWDGRGMWCWGVFF
jgi:hypothetical protein